MNEPAVEFVLNGQYRCGGALVQGPQSATCREGKIVWNGTLYDEITFSPLDPATASFTLKDVTIGVSFHWRRKEDQTFRGSLHLIVENGNITTINVLPVEEYLLSVISSEMSANASLELLKAHAVISRSWLLAQVNKSDADKNHEVEKATGSDSELEDIKWWDRDDHVNFDVCADDHCQRYQGITRESTPTVRQAIDATWGQVLMYDGELCDARFSKCCGGVLEEFENCWEPKHYDYLVPRRDSRNEMDFPDLSREDVAADWILSSPEAFCNTKDPEILSQVLNDYDQETKNFYRWKVEYTQEQIADLIKRRTGDDYGRIRDLQPVARGTSGRLYKMKIVGEKLTKTIGKELAIRYALSESALYSSAFIVERHGIDASGYPQKFVLRGAGWGHGVGLCQIGAAVMGAKGYNYKEILLHYFINASINKLYVGAHALFCRRRPLLCGQQYFGDDVHQDGCPQWRHVIFHHVALFPLVFKGGVEPYRRCGEDQALVDNHHADCAHCTHGAAHAHPAHSQQGDDSIGSHAHLHVHIHPHPVYHCSLCLGNSRHCGRWLLHAGSQPEQPGGIHRHSFHGLSHCLGLRAGCAGGHCRRG